MPLLRSEVNTNEKSCSARREKTHNHGPKDKVVKKEHHRIKTLDTRHSVAGIMGHYGGAERGNGLGRYGRSSPCTVYIKHRRREGDNCERDLRRLGELTAACARGRSNLREGVQIGHQLDEN